MAKNDISATVKKFLEKPHDRALARKLIAQAPAAFPVALAAARKDASDEVALLPLLRRLVTREAVPQLRKMAAEERGETAALVAMDLLAATGDAAALPTLREVLLDDEATSPHREAAAWGIGVLGDPAGLRLVKQVAVELIGDGAGEGNVAPLIAACREIAGAAPATVAMACVRAAACLGDHSLAPAAVALAAHPPSSEDPWDMEWGRRKAAFALQVAVAPGMVDALAKLLREGKELDAQRAALDALAFLGTKGAVAHMVAAAEDKYEPIGRPAASAVHHVAGAPADLAGPELVAWWKQHQGEFQPGACYRRGEPAHPPALFDLLDDAGWFRHAAHDLKTQTGRDFTYDTPVQANDWWARLEPKYEPGGLYRWGFKQELNEISE